MKLHELKALLAANPGKTFSLLLPGDRAVPQAFHITEVGFVNKTFIDCGGKVHTVQSCQLQAWIGLDVEHRLETQKLARILELSASVLPHEFLDVEIEYEDAVISQYPVREAVVSDADVTLRLTSRHTDCLAKELCLVPGGGGDACGCGPSGCCQTA